MKVSIIRKSIYTSIAVVVLFGVTACAGGNGDGGEGGGEGGGYYRSSGNATIYSNELVSIPVSDLGEHPKKRDLL